MRFRPVVLAFVIGISCPHVHSQWVQTNGPHGGNFRCLVSNGTTVFAGTDTGIFRSGDGGENWTLRDSGLTSSDVHVLAAFGTTLFAGMADGISRSTDGGTYWAPANTGIPSFPATLRSVNTFLTVGAEIFAGTRGRMYDSNDTGSTWKALDTLLMVPPVSAFASIGADLFAGTYGGGVYRSTDNGMTWSPVNTGIPTSGIVALAVGGTTLFAGTGSGVYFTTDLGAHWTPRNSHLADTGITALLVSGTTLLAGTPGGIYRLASSDTSWSTVDSGLTDLVVEAMTVGSGGDSFMYAGTHNGVVWKRPLSEILNSVTPDPSRLPAQFILSQNYPNPFNPTTTITYFVRQRSATRLQIVDALGRQVRMLVDCSQPGGWHTVLWDGTNDERQPVATGVYICRFENNGQSGAMKMVLLK